MFLVHLSLKNLSKTLTIKTLHYNSNTNQKYIQLIPSSHHSYLETTHTFRTYIIESRTRIRLKPNSSKFAHFPIRNYYFSHFTTTPKIRFFPRIPHTYFSTKIRITFNFIEVFTQDTPDTCSTIIGNSTTHNATLPTGHIGYIEVPITKEKLKHYQVNDINSLVHSVVHTYHPDITEPIPQTIYALQFTEEPSSLPSSSIHQVYLTDTITKLRTLFFLHCTTNF